MVKQEAYELTAFSRDKVDDYVKCHASNVEPDALNNRIIVVTTSYELNKMESNILSHLGRVQHISERVVEDVMHSEVIISRHTKQRDLLNQLICHAVDAGKELFHIAIYRESTRNAWNWISNRRFRVCIKRAYSAGLLNNHLDVVDFFTGAPV